MRNKGLSFYKKKKKISQELLREIFSWIFGIALSVFLAAVVVIFLGKSTRVVGMSMEPTLENGQQIFIDRFLYVLSSPKAGDIVAFLPNGNENSHYYVKRVVAGPGDKVRIADGTPVSYTHLDVYKRQPYIETCVSHAPGVRLV